MTAYRFPRRLFATLAGSALLLAGALVGWADEPAKPERKDDALDRLLEKLENAPPAPQAKSASPEAKPESAQSKSESESKSNPDGTKPGAGEVAPKDQALDSLLEKLGTTRDRPKTEDERKTGRPGPGEEKKDPADGPAPKPAGQPRPDELTGKTKDLDEHLEELTGRRRKKKQDEGQGGEENGPLGEVIKRMREVEQRLGKPDTGEETRKKQSEIVKNLEQLIEQARKSSSQSKQRKMMAQQGQKPGSQQPGQTPGANAGGAPNTKAAKPETKHAAVGGKDVWGHLPDELRQEMDNVSKEVSLPSREELIRLYYLSVSKKSLSRGD